MRRLFLIIALVFAGNFLYAQSSRGQIITPAITPNPMDPNGDGFVTLSGQPFSPLDPTKNYVPEFELKMFGLPSLGTETSSDNQTGPNCGMSDVMPDINGYSVYAAKDQYNNLIFRFRVGNNENSVQSWHILIDTDQKVGANDPNSTLDNPGFEIDITLVNKDNGGNYGVSVYNVDGLSNCPAPVLNYDLNQNFQVAVADLESCLDPDYFYDFFVAFDDIVEVLGPVLNINLNTGLRFVATTSLSATCSQSGSISDIAGIDNNDPLYDGQQGAVDALIALVEYQCPTPVKDLCDTCVGFNSGAEAPTIDLPIREGENKVTGTITEGNYVNVSLYRKIGGTPEAPIWSETAAESVTVQVTSLNTWSATFVNTFLPYDKITARAQYTIDGTGCDSSGSTSTALTVVNPNSAPVAQSQSVSVNEDSNVSIILVGTDPDPGNSITYSVVSGPAHGQLSCSDCSNPVFTPNADYNGSDSFTFKVSDGLKDSNVATVSITVLPVNDPPVANNLQVLYQLNTPVNFTLTGTDIDTGDILTYEVTQPVNIPGGELSGTPPDLTFTPYTDSLNIYSFQFTISDGTVSSEPATVELLPDGTNYPPVAKSASVSTNEDTQLVFNLSGSDVNGDPITFALKSNTQHGSISLTGNEVTYSPDLNYNGSDSFTFTTSDGSLESTVATITITVLPVNDAPASNDQDLVVTEDSSLNPFTLTGSDIDEDELTFVIIDQPNHGSVSGSSSEYFYTPEINFTGLDSLTFKTFDGTAYSGLGVVRFTVIPQNDAPVISDINIKYVDEDTDLNFSIAYQDIDSENVTVSLPVNISGGGTMTRSPLVDYSFTFSPAANFNGPTFWSVTVCDDGNPSLCSQKTFQIVVNPVNDQPDTQDDELTVQSYIFSETINLLNNDSDIDGDDLVLTETPLAGPYHGTVTLSSGGGFIYRSNLGFTGIDSVRYQVCDTGDPSLCRDGLIVITVTDPPFHIFEGLSPNNDGANDYWRINGIETYSDNRVKIFDRFNNLVFETTNYSNSGNNWHGQANIGMQSGNLPEGTYFYIVEINDGNKPYSGFVYLKKD
jgi:gliding motility-associated-like protein